MSKKSLAKKNWNSAQVSIRIKKSMLKTIDDLASKNQATRSEVIKAILQEYCVERGERAVNIIIARHKAASETHVKLFD